MWWLLLWPLLGFLGGGWWSYSVYRYDGDTDNCDSRAWAAWTLMGPITIVLNAYGSLKFAGRLYWGLRFK
jgi:hypothetical protein